MADMTSDEKKELYNRLSKIDSKVDKVFDLLNSDTHTNRPGLVQDVDTLKDDVRTLKTNWVLLKKDRAWIGAVAGFVGALVYWVGQIVINIIKNG